MNKILLGAVALVAIGAAPALAADLPAKVYTKAPAVAPAAVFDWTGFYLGANGGYGWSPGNTVTVTNNPGFTVTGVTGPGSSSGGFGGGQIGYNWQFGRFVVGAEGDIEGSAIKHSVQSTIDLGGDAALSSQNLNYFYTVRGRAGAAFDRALFYVTAGFAGGQVKDSILITNPLSPGVSATLTDSTSRTGYVVGGGVEYAFDPHWSVKGEYRYINLGSGTLYGPVLPPGGGVTSVSSTSVKDTFQTVRIGVNYRFGGPVIAKY